VLRIGSLSRVGLAVVCCSVFASVAAASPSRRSAGIPPRIKDAGKAVYCSDITFPPQEFLRNGKPVGQDIDLGNAIARLYGVRAEFSQTGFDGLIAALQSKKCDAILSDMTNTRKRAKQARFINYINVGQRLLVRAGNPKHISDLALAGGEGRVSPGRFDPAADR
jgi:polar amino acid transport system substrate-binding protein